MSISNFTELKAAVANYLHRTDLTSMIPEFITLAEAKLNRLLRIRAMENVATGNCSTSVSLPTGFMEMRSITATDGSSTWPLTYVTPNQINSNSSVPAKYSIVGDSIYFIGPSASYTYTMVYYKRLDPLSTATDGINWLITNAPDAYLYGTLMEAMPYIKDDQRVSLWADSLEAVITTLNRTDTDDRFGASLVVTGG